MRAQEPHRRGTEDAEYPQSRLTEQVLGAAFEVHSQPAGKSTGLLINFNTAHLRDGIRRVINPLRSSESSVPLR